MKVNVIVATLALLVSLPTTRLHAAAPASAPPHNRSLNSALSAATAINSPNARTLRKVVFFVTNRRIDHNAEDRVGPGKVLSYEDLFRNELVLATTYGAVELSYPANRLVGDQNYGPDSVRENPLTQFSIVDHVIANSADGFRTLITKFYPTVNAHSLLFVSWA